MTDTPTVEQRPQSCPVCGEPPKWRGTRHDYARGLFRLQCLGETHLVQSYGPSEAEAIAAWNTRTQQPRPDASVDGLAANVEALLWANLDLVNHRTEAVRELAARLAALTTREVVVEDDATVERVARIIDPSNFRYHESLVSHCLMHGDDDETAKRYADETHGPSIEAARKKARAVIRALAAKEVE